MPADEIRLAGADDAAVVGAVLADAFDDDPVMCWMYDPEDRTAKIVDAFTFLATEAHVGLGATWVTGDQAAAAWTPPGTPPWPQERTDRFLELLASRCSDTELERGGLLEELMAEHHPKEPHWYLGVIGVRRTAQGRGLGSALLRESLRRVDEEGLPAYLESSNPRNVPLYERYGFRVIGPLELPDGPTLDRMWREPQA